MGYAAMQDHATVAPARDLRRARDLIDPVRPHGGRWQRESLRGVLTELVGGAESANVSVAARLILHAQTTGDLAAWVATHRDVFFPPDLAAAGVDLAALPVVWAGETAHPPGRGADGVPAATAVRVTERLLRSGAFSLVIVDLSRDMVLPVAGQGRLLRLAAQHRAQVLILRRKHPDETYPGSLVAVRAESSRETLSAGRFRCTLTSTKDKREGPGWTTSEEFDGPPGLY